MSTGTDQAMNSSATSSGSPPAGSSTSTAVPIAAVADSYSFAFSTSSVSSQAVHLPRHLGLPNPEWNLWDDYRTYFYDHKDVMSLQYKRRRARILSQMTEEQKILFPVLCEEAEVVYSLVEVKDLKEELDQLVGELRLEAENDIDHQRGRY